VVTLIALVLVVGVVLCAMAPDARVRSRKMALALVREARHEATRSRPDYDAFRDALRARTRWAVVTPVLAASNIFIFARMVAAPGAVGDPETLVSWGANFWLLTRNGEWWRLVTSIFVHAGLFHLLVNTAVLLQVGLILERLLGRSIVAGVFLAAGIFASLVNLATHPMATGTGSSGSIFGLYGLLIAASVWSVRHRSSVTIPLTVWKMLAPGAGIFALYSLASGNLSGTAEMTGLLIGLISGTVLARRVSERKPAGRRIAQTMSGALAIAVLSAIPLSGITDVKPELTRTIGIEDRTASDYRKAADRFRNGRMSADALATLIEETIVPELQVAGARLESLAGVPLEHQGLVADAEEYVRLRAESWRLRSDWLRKAGKSPTRGSEAAQHRANNKTIALAEETERAALASLEKIRPSNPQ
jgi:membrane associated rhomboid family serine protease